MGRCDFAGTWECTLDSTLWSCTACEGGEEEEGSKGGGEEAVTGSCRECRGVASLSHGLHAMAALVAEVSGVAGMGWIVVRSASHVCNCERPKERPGPVHSASHIVHLDPSQLPDSGGRGRGRGRGASVAHTGVALETGERPSNTAAVVIGDVRSTTEFSSSTCTLSVSMAIPSLPHRGLDS